MWPGYRLMSADEAERPHRIEIGVVKGIVELPLATPATDEEGFVLGRMQGTPGGALGVQEFRIRRVDDPVATLAKPEAEIDIVERDSQPLVEATDPGEHSCSGHHARRGDGRAVPNQPAELKIVAEVDVARSTAAEAEEDAFVLRPTRREQQPSADGSDLWPLRVFDHRLQPARVCDLRVIVQ